MLLNNHTYYSLRYGTIPVEELLKMAAAKGHVSLALTDINNTSGVLDFVRLAPKHDIKPVVGIDFRDGVRQLYVGIAKNNDGFRELNDFLTEHSLEKKKLPVRAPWFKDVLVVYPFGSVNYGRLRENEFVGIRPSDLSRLPFSKWKNSVEKLIALTPVTFRFKHDFNAHRLLRAIDNNTLLSKLSVSEQGNETEVMLTETKIRALYQNFPRLVDNARLLLEQCHIHFEFGVSKNKKTFFQTQAEDNERLQQLTYAGLKYRYAHPDENILKRVNTELEVIQKLGYTSYFLINWDLLRYARNKGYYYIGRGSGANSIVAYCLRITDVDPIDLDLYFERFINPSRKNPPDFDIDFSWKDRDDITDYIFNKYNNHHAALLATYSTFQYKAVIRELGKVFGLPKHEIDKLSDEHRDIRMDEFDQISRLVFQYGQLIHGYPSHLSIHAGGILISEKKITNYTALNLPPKGFPTTQFSMLEAEDVGLYKFDILSQRGLGHIRDSVEIVRKNRNINIDIHDIKAFKRDPKIKANLRSAKAIGCFYVESPAMRMLLRKLEVDNYLGLVAASSIIRPGVAKSGMMREYILRHRFPEKRKEAHPAMMKIMPETYGVMVYQEDVIKVAHYFAGLTLEESDVMRRGMSGKFRSREEFRKVKDRFFENCAKRKYNPVDVIEIWRQIESFAGYSFAKGHSASYAVESYQSLFLKSHFPLEFMVGVINNFGGFYRTEFYVHEARMAGANIEAPCVNRSDFVTAIYTRDIYLGFIHVKDLEQKQAHKIIADRQYCGPFSNLRDFVKRVPVALEQLRIIIRVGAFRFTGLGKKELLWDAHLLLSKNRQAFSKNDLFNTAPKQFELPPLHYTQFDDAFDEIELLGFPLCNPFELLAEPPESEVPAAEIGQHLGKNILMAGYLVTIKNTSTSRGDRMCFGTFIDRKGRFIDTVHFPPVAAAYPFRGRGIYALYGKVTEEFGFHSLEVNRMEKLPFISIEEADKEKAFAGQSTTTLPKSRSPFVRSSKR